MVDTELILKRYLAPLLNAVDLGDVNGSIRPCGDDDGVKLLRPPLRLDLVALGEAFKFAERQLPRLVRLYFVYFFDAG
jgi:hypothetical protein